MRQLVISLTIDEPPVTSNHTYRRSNNPRKPMYMVDEASTYKRLVGYQATREYRGPLLTEDNLSAEIIHYFKDNRRRDCTNYSKALLDALQGIIYEDDRLIHPVLMDKAKSTTGKNYSVINIYQTL